MASVPCVLLGVAEVKVPVKRLSLEALTKVAQVAYWAVVHQGHETTQSSMFSKDRETFIGEVDDFYALREVEVKVNEEQEDCRIVHRGSTILQHRTKDVATVVPCKEFWRVVYISKSDSFGRAAVVLEMMSEETRQQLLALFPDAMRPDPAPQPSSNGVQSLNIKDHKSSLGRSMGKLTTMFMALSGGTSLAIASSPKRSPLPSRRQPKSPQSQESVNSDSDSSSEEDSVSDDTDSKSTGGYYEDMGLDANVQERLYDAQSSDSISRTSESSLEINAQIIEAELKFFLETDRDFLKTLQSLGADRERLASADTPQLLRGKVILLFSQVKALTEMHTQLHEEFEESDGNLQRLSEAIAVRQKEYENYVYFMENIPIVDSILETHKDYIKEHMPELPEKLRKPRMRLHYYVLTLETLCKKSSCRKDQKALNKAISVLKVPLKKADSKLFLGAVVGSPVDLRNFGDLLRHSDLSLRQGGDQQRRVYHVLMLKTLILLTLRDGRNYNYVTSFRMDQVGLGTEERGLIFDLKVRNGPRGQTVVYVFKAKNISLQQQWINDLKNIMKDKSQSSTPRNSYIEGDSDTRVSGKRSKVSRGSSVERLITGVSPIVPSNSISWDERDRSSTIENSKCGRRGAVRKSSSVNIKNHPMVRQPSGSLSDNEGGWNRRRMTEQSTPLNVWTIFPILKDFYYQKFESSKAFGLGAVYMEKEYIEGLRKIFGDVLNDELKRPPRDVITLLRHIMDFHMNVFMPMIEKSTSRVETAQCFVDCSEKLTELYPNYFVELTLNCDEFKYEDSLEKFKLPLNQFMSYVEVLSSYQRSEKDVIPSIQAALSTLRECVSHANALLLTCSVDGAPFDLGEHAPVLHEGLAKVRRTGLMIRHDCHLVLLDSMLLLLEPRYSFYRYVDALRMDTVGLGPVSDKHSFQLEVRTAATKTLLYAFRTPSAEAKDQWVREIMNILTLQAKRLKEKQKRRLGTSQGELVTVGASGLLYADDIKKISIMETVDMTKTSSVETVDTKKTSSVETDDVKKPLPETLVETEL